MRDNHNEKDIKKLNAHERKDEEQKELTHRKQQKQNTLWRPRPVCSVSSSARPYVRLIYDFSYFSVIMIVVELLYEDNSR